MWNRTYLASLGILTLTVGLIIGPDCNPPPVSSLRLVDANQQDLGMLVAMPVIPWSMGGGNTFTIFNEVVQATLAIDTQTGALVDVAPVGIGEIGILFSDVDCQGFTYVYPTWLPTTLLTWTPSLTTRHFVPSGTIVNDVSYQSTLQTVLGSDTCRNNPVQVFGVAQIAIERVLPFAVPVAVPLRIVPPTETP